MKKKIIGLVFTVALMLTSVITAFSQVDVSAQSAVLMCADNGRILVNKNGAKQLPMASTTKIMTSLLALEAAVPEKEITVTHEMVAVEGTSMGLVEGDRVSVNELVYGMLLQSGNDAANTVAYVVGGSPEEFAKLMNKRAAEIGMVNTNFVTASGLDHENHYSTAYDMALLACESLKNPEFAEICSKKNAKLTYGNPPYERTLTNHNRLLWRYDDSVGIKTGFTKKSGRCLVSAAERNGITLVAVTLNAPDDWDDHIRMFDYGFSVCEGVSADIDAGVVRVVGGEKSSAKLKLAYYPTLIKGEKCGYKLFLRPFEYAPIKEGAVIGKAVFISDDKIIREVPVITAESVERKFAPPQAEPKGLFSYLLEEIKVFFRGEPIGR